MTDPTEIMFYIKILKKTISPGFDGINNNALKNLSLNIIMLITSILESMVYP